MLIIALYQTVKDCYQRQQTRKQLQQCDADTLRDIGISRVQQYRESQKASISQFILEVCRKTLSGVRH